MADFQVMGGVPDFYTQLMNAARQQLVQMPDGTYAPAPQYGQQTSLDEIYGGILPTGPTERSVATVPITRSPRDPVGPGPGPFGTMQGFAGDPIYSGDGLGFSAPTLTATRDENRSGIRPAVTEGVEPAGSRQMPLGARPASVDRAFAQMGIQPSGGIGRGQPTQTAQAPSPLRRPIGKAPVWDPFNPNTPKDISRLPTDLAYMTGPPPPANDALEAIDQLTGSGRDTAQPLPLPFSRRPVVSGAPGKVAPTPLPRPRPSDAPSESSSDYTVKKGDTLWAISKRTGISVPDLAVMNNIKDPSKLSIGQKLSLGGSLDGLVPTGETYQGRPLYQKAPAKQPAARPLPSRSQSSSSSSTPLYGGPNVIDELGMKRYHG